MRIPWPFKRKLRWTRQVDAYVDDRLTPIEQELLFDELEESPEVKAMLDETNALKRALRRMPEHHPRRSFHITPAMVQESKPAPAPRAPAVTMRLAQATTFAAIAGLAVTGAVHLSESADDQLDGGMPAIAEIAEDNAGAPSDSRAGDVQDGAMELTPLSDPEYRPATDDALGDERPAAEDLRDGHAEVDRDAGALSTTSDSPAFWPIYSALGAVLALAAGTWLFTRNHLKGIER